MKIKQIFAWLIFCILPTIPTLATAQTAFPFIQSVPHSRVCNIHRVAGLASCNAYVVVDGTNKPLVSKLPQGYGPAQIRGAYNLTGKAPNTKVVAIVDAYDDPTLQQDINSYSQYFSLPILPTCKIAINKSTAPCFEKLSQRGTLALPKINSSWSMEIALDVEAVHAVCENCSIVVLEANSPNTKNLLAAEDKAVELGAQIISNSWGGPEFAGEQSLDSHFNHPGIAITVSSGDAGYGVQYPAASPYVTAVGGTSLYVDAANRYEDENAWSGAGSGCSVYEPKPAWQTDNKCNGRTVTDVSAVADPATGFAVYSSTSPKGAKGWFTVGGTSLAAPIIAAAYADSGNIPVAQQANSLPYDLGSKANLHDVVGGSNGDCDASYLCSGKTKYDGPTGLGSPKGTGAF